MFWKDLHSVTGLWGSFFVLFLLLSGLPWAKNWGGYLKRSSQSRETEVKLDWTTGRSSEIAARLAKNPEPLSGGEHSGHSGKRGRTAALL